MPGRRLTPTRHFTLGCCGIAVARQLTGPHRGHEIVTFCSGSAEISLKDNSAIADTTASAARFKGPGSVMFVLDLSAPSAIAQPVSTPEREVMPGIRTTRIVGYSRGRMAAGLGYAVWPRGRLVGIVADDFGEFTMIPIIAPGMTPKVNAVTHRTARVKIEMAGVNGRSLAECTPTVGYQHSARITWKAVNHMGVDAGQPVTLRVQFKQATLFGLEID